jgi:rsbT co-antagonist protein RsbR
MLANLSASRATAGFTPSETEVFVLSLKPSLFDLARQNWSKDANDLFAEISVANDFVDKLALYTTDSYIHGRDQVITGPFLP